MIHSTAYLQLFIKSVHAEFVPNIAVSSSLVMVINRQVQTFYFPKLPGNSCMLNSDRQTNNIKGGLIKKNRSFPHPSVLGTICLQGRIHGMNLP